MNLRSPRQSDHDPLAAEERARVIAAARGLLAEEQGAALTADALAARAGVARAQLQRRFGTLAGALEALWDELFAEGCLARFPQALALPDPEAALDELIAIHGRLWDRERRVIRRLLACAALDPELERALLVRERQRREALRKLATRLSRVPADRGGSFPPLTTLDLLALLTGFALFDQLAGPERPIAEIVPEVQTLAQSALYARA